LRSVYADNTDKRAGGHVLAAFYVRHGRNDEAEKVLDELLQTWPDKVAVYLLYANYLVDTNFDQARAAIEKAIELGPKDPRGYRSLALLLMEKEDWPEAADSMAKYMELQPDDTGAAKELIGCYLEANQLPQAEQKLSAMLAASPSDPDLLALKGNLAMKRGNIDQALEDFDRAIQIKPNHLEALLGQVNALFIQGKITEAKIALTKARAISKDPRLAIALKTLHLRVGDEDMAVKVLQEVLNNPETANYAPAMRELVRLYEQRQRWSKLAETLVEARKRFPDDPYYLLVEARLNQFSGKPDQAVVSMEEALKLAPESREVLRDYLLALLEAGDFEKILTVSDAYKDKPAYGPVEMAVRAQALVKLDRAEQAGPLFRTAFQNVSSTELPVVMDWFRKAFGPDVALAKMTEWAKTSDNTPLFYMLVGALSREAKDYPKAIEALTKAESLATQPKDKAMVTLELGLAYYHMGKFPEAEKAYLACIQASGEDPVPLNNLAFMYVSDMNQPDKALPYAAKAANKAPSNAEVLDTYGWVLAKTGSYDLAEKQWTRALQLSLSPTSATMIRYHLGWVCEQTHRLEEAARHYRQVSESLTDPNNAFYQEVAEALKRVQPTPSTTEP
jgi:tetratricopeptide (TPR) repeat protein